jgi:rhodanese-related sulfurtransferase
MKQLDPKSLKTLLETTTVRLIDVREPSEFSFCRLPGSVNLPVSQIADHLREFELDEILVTVCHHGLRSFAVAEFLEAKGFSQVINLQGGLDAWSREVDPSIPRY